MQVFIHSFIHSLSEFNLLLIGALMWLTPSRPYRNMTYRKKELTLDHIHTFWPHKDKQDLPVWGISSMPGTPPRQHEYERLYTPFTHPFILTMWISKDDYGGQMIFGDIGDLKVPDIYLTGEETSRKTSPRKLLPTGDRTRARCVTGEHATACSIAVDTMQVYFE